MSKIVLNKRTAEQDILAGMALAQGGKVLLKDNLLINSQLAQVERVTIVGSSSTGGLPVMIGLVVDGLLDVAVAGNEIAAAGPAKILEALGLADRGQGVLLVTMADEGSTLTGNIVAHILQKANASVKQVIVKDAEDRGSLGVVSVLKFAMEAAQGGMKLEEVATVAEGCAKNTVSVVFRTSDLQSTTSEEFVADQLIKEAVEKLAIKAGDKVMLCLNGNEVASLREQYAVYGACYGMLTEAGVEVVSVGAGNYLCGQENVFVQLALSKLGSEE